jgi:hypothetical protein
LKTQNHRFSAEGCANCPKRKNRGEKSLVRHHFPFGVVYDCPDCPKKTIGGHVLVGHEFARRKCTQGFRKKIPIKLSYEVCLACFLRRNLRYAAPSILLRDFKRDFERGVVYYCIISSNPDGYLDLLQGNRKKGTLKKDIHVFGVNYIANHIISTNLCPYATEHIMCSEENDKDS